MQLGFVGLGKMGLNMVTRLTRGGHDDRRVRRQRRALAQRAAAAGCQTVASLEALVAALRRRARSG